MKEKIKLKPCPFCGSENVGSVNGWVQCFDCNASGPDDYNNQTAIEMWNKRSDK